MRWMDWLGPGATFVMLACGETDDGGSDAADDPSSSVSGAAGSSDTSNDGDTSSEGDASTSSTGVDEPTTAPPTDTGNGPACPLDYVFEPLPDATVGVPYEYDAPPTSAPSFWEASFDGVTPGLVFGGPDGDIVGTPEIEGEYTIVANLASGDGGQCSGTELVLVVLAGEGGDTSTGS